MSGFWDQYEAKPAPAPAPEEGDCAQGDLWGTCIFCDVFQDDVILGVCASCAPPLPEEDECTSSS